MRRALQKSDCGRVLCWLVGVAMEGKLEKVTGIGSTYTRLPSAILDVFEILGLRYTVAPFFLHISDGSTASLYDWLGS